MSYIEVHPEPAAQAARNTAATGDDWSAWAARAETALGDASSGARESVVAAAFDAFIGDLSPRLRAISTLAEKQGNDLGVVVDTAVDTDLAGASTQQAQLSAAQHQTSVVSRPVNAV